MIYKNIILEICGKCNAKCKYCYTGRVNRGLLASDECGCITPEKFSEALAYLYNKGLMGPETHFCLYNYGEPFMHPQFSDIMQIMDANGHTFELSTNGSIPLDAEAVQYMRHLIMLKFSVCGFSQASFDRISRLSFSFVKSNIVHMLRLLRDAGWKGTASLKFHVYSHNLDEVELAHQFAQENGMVFTPIHAIIGDLRMQVDWLEGDLDKHLMEEVERDLVTSEILHSYAKHIPANWQCPLTTDLIIDENLTLVNCCMATRNDKEDYRLLGGLYEFDGVRDQRCLSSLGRRCYAQGVGYAINSIPTYRREEWLDAMEKILRESEMDVIGSGFIYESFSNVFGKMNLRWNHYNDIEEYSLSEVHGEGIVLADALFHHLRQELHDRGIPREKILGIYNINLR